MKKILCSAMLAMVFLGTGVCGAEVPDLLGNWTGSWSGYDEGKGYSNFTEDRSIILTFAEQEGRIFAGNITFEQDNETVSGKGFAGAIGLDNKTLYIAEFDKGYSWGSIISDDEMELIYLADGENASAAIDRLYRMKT